MSHFSGPFGRKPFAAISIALLLLAACGGENNGNNGNNGAADAGADGSVEIGDDAGGDAGDDGGAGADADASSLACGEPTGMRPPRLSEHAGAFVPGAEGSQDSVVIFGGSLGIPENCGIPQRTYETTTWLYDVDCDSWSRLESATTPPGRTRHTAIHDPIGNRVVVFGGLGQNGARNDTWALDLETGAWSELETTGTLPPARLTHAAAYDPAGRMLVFGGNTGSVVGIQPADDVWSLDLSTNTWTDVTPAQAGPEPRLWVSALWDPELSQLVIFGGGDDSAFTGVVSYFDDVWAWSDAEGAPTWTQLDATATAKPDGRFWAGWTYDAVNGQYMLFGGHDDTDLGNRNDTWFFDPSSGRWTAHLGGDVWNKPANGVCDFPPDFTVVEDVSPERRNAHVQVSSPTGAFIMGGKTDCGVIDDLARFDLASGEWETLTRATAGEVCLRRGGGDSCSGLCL